MKVKHTIRVGISIALLVAAMAAMFSYRPAGAQVALPMTVTTGEVNVRQGPGTNYTVEAVVGAGEQVTATGQDATGTWYQVQLPNGLTGWISAALLQPGGDASTLPQVAAPVPPAASVASGGAGPVRGAGAGSGSHIVFQSSSGGPIYVMNPDGSGLRQLTTGIDPAISPDGSMVAYTRWNSSSDGAPGDLWVINIDGSNEHKVLANVDQPKAPTWSPDGQQITVSMQSGGTLGPTWTCFVNGKIATKLPHPSGGRCRQTPPDPHWGLRVVNLATGQWQDLPRDIYSFTPTWDPAQAWRIVYHGDNGLVNLDVNQSKTYPLNSEVPARSPVFSPDGSKLLVTFLQSDHWEIHVMNADGSGEVRLTETSLTDLANQMVAGQTPKSADNAAATWSPDGSQIAFLSDRRGVWEIWIMNADGSNQHPLFANGMPNGITVQYNGVDERVLSWR